MSLALAKFAIAALLSGAAVISGAGPGWLKVLFPKRGTTVEVRYVDRDRNGYLSFDAPNPRFRDVLTGARVVRETRFSARSPSRRSR